jgi:hypothetical protein
MFSKSYKTHSYFHAPNADIHFQNKIQILFDRGKQTKQVALRSATLELYQRPERRFTLRAWKPRKAMKWRFVRPTLCVF